MKNLDRFKFRGWCKPGKYMFTEDKGLEFYHKDGTIDDSMSPALLFSGDFVFFDLEDHNDNGGINDEDLIIMQSTGLRDKNDNLIFEKDIIDFGDDNLGAVAWDEERCLYYVIALKGDEEIISDLTRDFYRISAYEIIGNIYENKEL